MQGHILHSTSKARRAKTPASARERKQTLRATRDALEKREPLPRVATDPVPAKLPFDEGGHTAALGIALAHLRQPRVEVLAHPPVQESLSGCAKDRRGREPEPPRRRTSLTVGARRPSKRAGPPPPARPQPARVAGELALALEVQTEIDRDGLTYREVARRHACSRQRICRLLALARLAPDIQDQVARMTTVTASEGLDRQSLEWVAEALDWAEQRQRFAALGAGYIRATGFPPAAAVAAPPSWNGDGTTRRRNHAMMLA